MHTKYYKEYSYILEREMEFTVHGHGGKPCLVFPAQDGRFYDFFNFGMIESAKNFIEAGKLQLFCVDGLDWESWSFKNGNYRDRIIQHEKWFHYITQELAPRCKRLNEEMTEREYIGKILTTGCSMGAYHGLNFLLRRPDIFDGTIAMSGLYNAEYFFPNYNDELIYFNSPVDYMKNISKDHEYMEMYNKSQIIICCGQGRWEEDGIRDAKELEKSFKRLEVPAWVDLWGYDVDHDWPWWKVQFPYFLEKIL